MKRYIKWCIIIAIVAFIALAVVVNGGEEMTFEDWAVVTDYGDCCSICNGYMFYALGITKDYKSWSPTEFHISKIDLITGEKEDITYIPLGYSIALVPIKNELFIVSIDHDSVETESEMVKFRHYYSLTIARYDFVSHEVSVVYSETKEGEAYSYDDVVADDDRIILINSQGNIYSFDTKESELVNVYKTESRITNDLFTNHAVVFDHSLYFSIESGSIICLNLYDYTSYLVTDRFYEKLPADPAMKSHYCYYIFDNKLYYWNDREQIQQSIDLSTHQRNTEDTEKTCFWWIGRKGMYYSKWFDGKCKRFYYSYSDNDSIIIENYIEGCTAFAKANGYNIDFEEHHSTRW